MTHEEMACLITELEWLTTAQADTVLALTRAGNDATEAWQRLYEQMDRLNALRQEWRAAIELPSEAERAAASKAAREEGRW